MQPPSPPPACPGPPGWAQLCSLVGDLPASCAATGSHCCTSCCSATPPSHTSCTSEPRQLQRLWRWSLPKIFFQYHGLRSFFFFIVRMPAINLCWRTTTTGQAPDRTVKRLPKCRAQCNQQQSAPCPPLTPSNSLEFLHLLQQPLAFQTIYFRVCKANSHFPQD